MFLTTIVQLRILVHVSPTLNFHITEVKTDVALKTLFHVLMKNTNAFIIFMGF